MFDPYNISVNVMVVILGVCIGYLLYKYFIRTHILEPACLIDSDTCVKMSYWSYGNSVLFHVEPNGYWCWFNGTDLFIYDATLTSSKCPQGIYEDSNLGEMKYQSAYKLDRLPNIYSTTNNQQIVCIDTVDSLIRYYESLNVKKRLLYDRVPYELLKSSGYTRKGYKQLSVKWDVYDSINLFNQKNIITIPK
jgi:hypothetical protein